MRPFLVLAATNLVTTLVLFGLYLCVTTGALSESAFQVALAGVLATFLVVWIRAERSSGRRLTLPRRLAAAVAALAAVVVAAPMVVLTPIFAIESQLPPSAGFTTVAARSMVLLRVSLQVLIAANVAAALASPLVAAFVRRRDGRRPVA